jgi:hypothetical protein
VIGSWAKTTTLKKHTGQNKKQARKA